MNHIQELLRCRDSFTHFFANYIKVTHRTKGTIPLELHPFQQKYIDNIEKHRFNVAIKFRGSGLTTITQLWALWRCMFYDDQRIMTIGNRAGDATHLGKLIRTTFSHLPAWMVPAMDENTDERKVFRLTGSVLEYGGVERVLRHKLTAIILDDAAFIKKLAVHWGEMLHAVAEGKVIAASITNGIDPWFFETWRQAEQGTNDFHCYRPHYKEHPDFVSEEWEKGMRLTLGKSCWIQEVEGCFLLTGESPILGVRRANHA